MTGLRTGYGCIGQLGFEAGVGGCLLELEHRDSNADPTDRGCQTQVE